MASCQKLGIILENKAILKLMLSKNDDNKKCAPRFYRKFLNSRNSDHAYVLLDGVSLHRKVSRSMVVIVTIVYLCQCIQSIRYQVCRNVPVQTKLFVKDWTATVNSDKKRIDLKSFSQFVPHFIVLIRFFLGQKNQTTLLFHSQPTYRHYLKYKTIFSYCSENSTV